MKGGSEASPVGQLVGGKYRIVRLLARGGMGVVYEAQHTVVRRRFAIKFLRRDLAERRDVLTRFQHEAEAAGALENENVTAAVDFGISDDGTPYIVMEYLVGESLASLLERNGRLPVPRAADLVSQACRGVEAAHAAGIVHRDLKPQNLFVSRRDDGTDLVKVLDFGVAKLQAFDEASAATGTGTVLGTAAYMSPEQARGEKLVDRRTDVYALGAILYELVSQRRPHPGDSQNAILHHTATQPAVPLDAVQPDLPAELVEVVGRALASDPAGRPPSADALARALAKLAHRRVWPGTRDDSGLARAARTSTLPAPEDGGSGPPAPPATGRRLTRSSMAVGAGLAVAALAVAIGAGVRTKEEAPGQPSPRPPLTLAPTTRFYVPPARPEASQQISHLTQTRAFREAALLSAMAATPRAVWFQSGSPEEVESAVHETVLRATRDGELPVLVPHNHPYRDCAPYQAGGARSAAEYQAWFDGFVRGVGNERVVVILEPDSLGVIPNNTALDGAADRCRQTVTDAQGRTVPAPGASADARYALLSWAIDHLGHQAPNALVYLDGAHSAGLRVAEIASRLAKAGVERTQGFTVNVSNFRPTAEAIEYGTWISRCLAYARGSSRQPAPFQDCPSPRRPSGASGKADGQTPERWVVDHADSVPSPAVPPVLAHFVIDTSRNGRGPLDASIYAAAPYNQPPEVVAKLGAGSSCNPPGAGLGSHPTARTNIPLVDAVLWIKEPGTSDGSCDIAGGPRAWDYSRYNPWGITGDAQKHFDPLWGKIDPRAGEWFPAQALQLALNPDPPLQPIAPDAGGGPPGAPSESVGRSVTRPVDRVTRRSLPRPPSESRGRGEPAPARGLEPSRQRESTPPPPPVTFDQQNPYN